MVDRDAMVSMSGTLQHLDDKRSGSGRHFSGELSITDTDDSYDAICMPNMPAQASGIG